MWMVLGAGVTVLLIACFIIMPPGNGKMSPYLDENGNTVDSISIYLSDDTLADMYPSYFDYDDDWGTYTEDIEMVYTTGDVNIRKGPGKDYGSAGVIKADTVVTYLGNSSVDERGVVWYNILYNNNGFKCLG